MRPARFHVQASPSALRRGRQRTWSSPNEIRIGHHHVTATNPDNSTAKPFALLQRDLSLGAGLPRNRVYDSHASQGIAQHSGH